MAKNPHSHSISPSLPGTCKTQQNPRPLAPAHCQLPELPGHTSRYIRARAYNSAGVSSYSGWLAIEPSLQSSAEAAWKSAAPPKDSHAKALASIEPLNGASEVWPSLLRAVGFESSLDLASALSDLSLEAAPDIGILLIGSKKARATASQAKVKRKSCELLGVRLWNNVMRCIQPLRQAAAASPLPLRLQPLHAELLGTLETLARCSRPGWLSQIISATDDCSSYAFYQHEARLLVELRNVLGPHDVLVGAGGGDGVTAELYDRAELETPSFVTKHLIAVLRVTPIDQVPSQVLDQLCMDLEGVCTRQELVHELQRNETKTALSSLRSPSTNCHGSAPDPVQTCGEGRLEGAVPSSTLASTLPSSLHVQPISSSSIGSVPTGRLAVAPPSQVFVSHVAQESGGGSGGGGGGDDFARKLVARLEGEGYSVFMSDSAGGGHSWGRIMDTAIRNCTVFIPIISPSYGDTLTSKWVGANALASRARAFALRIRIRSPWRSATTQSAPHT